MVFKIMSLATNAASKFCCLLINLIFKKMSLISVITEDAIDNSTGEGSQTLQFLPSIDFSKPYFVDLTVYSFQFAQSFFRPIEI